MSENTYPIVPMVDIRRFRYLLATLERGLNPSKRFPLENLDEAAIYLVRLRDVAEEIGLSPLDKDYPTISIMTDLKNCLGHLRSRLKVEIQK